MYAPIQTAPTAPPSPTMVWPLLTPLTSAPRPKVTATPQVGGEGCPPGSCLNTGGCIPVCRKIPGVSADPKLLTAIEPAVVATGALGALATGAIDPQSGMSLVSGVVTMAINGVAGYFVGKWTGASKGWTAAGAALLGVPGTAASVYFTGKKKVQPNRRRRNRRRVKPNARTAAQTWDLLWGNHIAARKSGSKQRILDTAELLEAFDRSRGWKPTVTVAQTKKEYGWS